MGCVCVGMVLGQNVLLPRNDFHPLQQHSRNLAVDVLAHRGAVGRGLGGHGEAWGCWAWHCWGWSCGGGGGGGLGLGLLSGRGGGGGGCCCRLGRDRWLVLLLLLLLWLGLGEGLLVLRWLLLLGWEVLGWRLEEGSWLAFGLRRMG